MGHEMIHQCVWCRGREERAGQSDLVVLEAEALLVEALGAQTGEAAARGHGHSYLEGHWTRDGKAADPKKEWRH